MKSEMFEFKLNRQVEFADTDMAGIMHFSNFFRFMEAAEHAFFRSLGFSIYDTGHRQAIGWPRVHASCDFCYPLKFEDIVEIHLRVLEKRKKSLVYLFVFRRLNKCPVREVARGTLVVACVSRRDPLGPMVSIPIPKGISSKIGVVPKE